jgi:large subunit ribosomal protein L49
LSKQLSVKVSSSHHALGLDAPEKANSAPHPAILSATMISRTLRPLRAATAPRIPLAAQRITPISFRALATESTSTPSSSEPAVATSQSLELPSIPAGPSGSAAPQAPRQLPYFVGRNQLHNLSVYQRKMRGGSLKKTLLKRGEGNLMALKEDVADALGLTGKEVTVNHVTKHIEVKVCASPRVANLSPDMPIAETLTSIRL